MQATESNMRAGEQNHAATPHMRKRIGSTVYEVCMYFNRDAKEEMEDKILRMIRNDLNNPAAGANMTVPQTSRLPERSSAA